MSSIYIELEHYEMNRMKADKKFKNLYHLKQRYSCGSDCAYLLLAVLQKKIKPKMETIDSYETK
jgi:hypothetical protein